MKKVFFSKQGVLFRIIYSLFNMIIILPVSLSISFVLRFIIKDNGIAYYRFVILAVLCIDKSCVDCQKQHNCVSR